MNKKTGEFSAADLKKPVGRKPHLRAANGEGGLLNTSPIKGQFVCHSCRREHPESEIGRDGAGGRKHCITCEKRIASIQDGSIRYNGSKHESHKAASARSKAKAYRKGRLPAWMFS